MTVLFNKIFIILVILQCLIILCFPITSGIHLVFVIVLMYVFRKIWLLWQPDRLHKKAHAFIILITWNPFFQEKNNIIVFFIDENEAELVILYQTTHF